ncbi:hypothetical protein [Variovorax sp. IB41]|uniref:hypothetical protein n=1 Tax=Variovorax sp. IB41 TaxID=2779370 RepID=UPI0018E84FD4|nr:hypothetical protein [Variovorax sp. IB41]MBJ2158575.1 hypothetical protein [Variovorax sp. IB41]
MDYHLIFLSLLEYFLQSYGFIIFAALVYSGAYVLLGWVRVRSRLLRLGLTLLCVPLLSWIFAFRHFFFSAENASEFWGMAVDAWREVFTAPSMVPWTVCTMFSMVTGLILCSVVITKKRHSKKRLSAPS